MDPERGRVALIVNPSAGRGRAAAVVPGVADRLRAGGSEVTVLTSTGPEHLVALAAAAARGDHGPLGLVVACGGDGTLHWVLQGLMAAPADTRPALGVLPVGTGDDNARGLGVPIGDPEAAADLLLGGAASSVDVARADGEHGTRWFLGVMSSGFDSNVNERANRMTWPSGQSRYTLAILRELSSFAGIDFDVDLDGTALHGRGMLVSVGNGRSYGGGMLVCPDAVVDDGVLDLTWLHEVGKPTFLRAFPKVFKGTHVELPYVSVYRGRSVSISAPGQVAYADGERVGPLPVTVAVEPGALRIVTGPGAAVASSQPG